MPNEFDLTLLPLYRLDGRELSSPPGLMAITPPRKRVRGRERDRLIIHLMLAGNAPSSTANYIQMTARAAEIFYTTSGSLTAAMRTAAETLNSDLLERNLSTSGQGLYVIGNLTLAALRGEEYYFLQCGSTHIFSITAEGTKHTHDSELAGRGLGLSQTTKYYLSRFPLHPRGRLLLAAKLPTEWLPALQRDSGSASLEATRRRLIAQTAADLNAVLIEHRPGRGDIRIQKPELPKLEAPDLRAETPVAEKSEQPAAHIIGSVPPVRQLSPEEAPSAYALPPQPQAESTPPAPKTADSFPSSIPRAAQPPPADDDWHTLQESTDEQQQQSTGAALGETVVRQTARTLASGIQAARKTNKKVSRGIHALLPKLLPNSDPNTTVNLPNWTMALIAIAIPLFVVTVASVVYFNTGKNMQYQEAYTQASTSYARAQAESDPVARRLALENTLIKLDDAEKHANTDESRTLRTSARHDLDALLGIARPGFIPTLEDLPNTVKIINMAATDTDLYLLDGNEGRILRAFLTGRGYQLDQNFLCAPGEYGAYTVGRMVDMQILPTANALGASVMGIDNNGNLLYCTPNEVPQSGKLNLPPTGINQVTSIVIEDGILYLLDAPARAIWVYIGKFDSFPDFPTFFFEDQIPVNLEKAIDMVVNDYDLYLLFNDGQMASCTYSRITSVPTRCTDQVKPVDPNPAAGGGDTFASTHFNHIILTRPPDASLLLADAAAQAVYRISPRSFELQKQIHTKSLDHSAIFADAPLTAITASPGHTLFIAQGSKVVYLNEMP
ncbi:MAG: hypothetical protein L3J16_01690 [Anaerolineales bacterium]|nr:hypothetical protein [Anaerolineales bacterium]